MPVNKSLILIVFLILTLLASLTLVFRTTIFLGKATGSNTSGIALENSYLFASPLQAKADSKEQIRVTVFLLDGRGLGVPNKTVSLKLPQTITSSPTQPVTDDAGRAIFDISSPIANKFDITAVTDGQSLPQKVKVTFY
jgi:hypothetical protein